MYSKPPDADEFYKLCPFLQNHDFLRYMKNCTLYKPPYRIYYKSVGEFRLPILLVTRFKNDF